MTDDARGLDYAARERGWDVTRLNSWRLPADLQLDADLAIFGEPLFARIVAAQGERVLLEPPLDWLTAVPRELTARKIQVVTFASLPSVGLPAFIKPPDDKIFAAQVYASLDPLVARADIDPSQPVLVSEPVAFATEFRCHVLDGRTVACCRYSVAGEISIGSDDPDVATAAEFAQQVASAAAARTPPAVVIDVGRLDTGRWAVVEANPAFGAGIYGADSAAVLPVLLSCCRSPSEVKGSLASFVAPVTLEA